MNTFFVGIAMNTIKRRKGFESRTSRKRSERKSVMLESVASDANFSDSDIESFADGLWDELSGNYSGWSDDGRINGETLGAILENAGLAADWEVYGSDEFGTTLAINVKNRGQGNWNRFNLNGRAEELGMDLNFYSEYVIQFSIENFHDDWNEKFVKDCGLEFDIIGRKGSH